MKALRPLMAFLAIAPAIALGQVIVNDNWADGGRTNGADPLDIGWWTSTSATAIEVSTGSLGLVNSTSVTGNGIHGTFTPHSLSIGDTLTLTFTFTTPATIGTDRYSPLRVGLFNTLGRGGLTGDLTASEVSPNFLYNGLPGYWVDWDVNATNANITFRQHNPAATSGQLLADGNDYPMISARGSIYAFAAGTSYTGLLSITRTGADAMSLTGTLYQGGTELSTWLATDSSGIVSYFDMVAFHLNPSAFGSSTTPGMADNGIDFTNITLSTGAVPEPATCAWISGLAAFGFVLATRRKRAK